MNSIFSRLLKSLCVIAAAVVLTACGSSSTVDPFVATRVIAFGDGFNFVDTNGYGLSTVRTPETDNTIAGRVAARHGIVVKAIATNPLAATGGFSYASKDARVANVATQINTFLTSAGGVVAKKDLIIITVGNWDVYDAARANVTTLDSNTTALVTAIQRLTNAGAEHVVVMPAINMSRTPWATSINSTVSRATIQNLSNSASTSFNFSLEVKLNSAYRQDRKPVAFLDRTSDFNNFAGSVDVSGVAIQNFSGISLTNLATAVCAAPSPAEGCAVPGTTDYLTSVFADEINLTPVMNRYLADRLIASMVSFGWSR